MLGEKEMATHVEISRTLENGCVFTDDKQVRERYSDIKKENKPFLSRNILHFTTKDPQLLTLQRVLVESPKEGASTLTVRTIPKEPT